MPIRSITQNKEGIHSGKLNYMFLEIYQRGEEENTTDREMRRRVEYKQLILTNRLFQSSSMNEDR